MPHNRFFLDEPFGQEATLSDEEVRHVKVMRIQEGDTVELVNGRNQLAHAKVISIGKKEIHLKIQSIEEKPTSHTIILCQAIPRANRLDSIIEKGTELGMTELWLFPGERSEKKHVNLARAKSIMIAAMKQCGRLDLPHIHLKPPLKDWHELKSPAYFGDLDPNAPPFLSVFAPISRQHSSRFGQNVFPDVEEPSEGRVELTLPRMALKTDGNTDGQSGRMVDEKWGLEWRDHVLFFIGPESGLTENEETHLRHLGAIGVNLHPNTLRTDTAPLVALSLISASQSSEKCGLNHTLIDDSLSRIECDELFVTQDITRSFST